MTADQLLGLVERWPGRWHHGPLLELLYLGTVPLHEQDLGIAVLEGLGRAQTAAASIGGLLTNGRFALVDDILTELADAKPEVLDPATFESLREQLDAAREQFSNEIKDWREEVAIRCSQTGLERPDELDDVVELAGHDGPAARHERERINGDLGEVIAHRSDELKAAVASQDTDDEVRRCVLALVEQKELVAADALISASRPLAELGPIAVPRGQTFPYTSLPIQKLRSYYSNHGSAPPSFSRWQPSDEIGRELISAWLALTPDTAGGQHVEADAMRIKRFAAALDRVLGSNDGTYHPSPVGPMTWQIYLRAGFHDVAIGRFAPPEGLNLVVTLENEWPDLSRVARPAAVLAPNIPRPAGGSLPPGVVAGDGHLAVLAPELLVALAQRPPRPAVTLARSLGSQWSPDVLVGENGRRLDGTDWGRRWTALSWVLDLLGVDTPAARGRLAFETGLHPELLATLLTGLLEQQASRSPLTSEKVRAWPAAEELRDQLHTCIRRIVSDNPLDLAVLWSVTAAGALGEAVDVEFVQMALDEESHDVDSVQLDDVIHALDRLCVAGLARPGQDAATWVIHRSGVMARVADAPGLQVESLLRAWVTHQSKAAKRIEVELVGLVNRLVRHRRAKMLASLETVANPEQRELLQQDLNRVTELTTADLPTLLAGTSQVAPVVDLVVRELSRGFPAVEITTHLADLKVTVATSEVVVYLLLDLVAYNAAESLVLEPDGGGEISIEIVRHGPGKVTFDVRDTGHGIAAGIDVFSHGPDGTTRGRGRGRGLPNGRDLARLIGGDLELVAAAGVDSGMSGAHFRVTMPAGWP